MNISNIYCVCRPTRAGAVRFFLALMFSLSVTANAQVPTFAWANQVGGAGEEAGELIAVDAAGNSYVAGQFSSTDVAFGDFSPANGKWFLAKYDTAGGLLWVKTVASNIHNINSIFMQSIAVDGAGNSYITGYLRDTTTFGGTTLTNTSDIRYSDVFVAKYDSVGNAIWAKQAGGTKNDKARGIGVDAAGDCIVTGFFTGTATFGNTNLTANALADEDIFVVRYDPSGNVVWASQAGGGLTDEGYGIAVDPSGTSYVTGFFASPAVTFGNTILIPPNGNGVDIFVAKYDSAGKALWARQAGGSGQDVGYSIAMDPAGNSYVLGDFYSTNVAFGTHSITNSGDLDIFVAKYDNAGNLLWVNQAGGSNLDFSTSIAVDAAGNSYIAGGFSSTYFTFGGTTLTNNSNENTFDIFAAKYDSVGNAIWAKAAGGTDTDGSLGIGVVGVDSTGNCYLTGLFISTNASFDSITLTNGGDFDMFVAKINGPQLSMGFAGNQLVVSWPTNATGLHLQFATSSASPVVWMDSTNTPTLSGEQFKVLVDATDGGRLYRLKGP